MERRIASLFAEGKTEEEIFNILGMPGWSAPAQYVETLREGLVTITNREEISYRIYLQTFTDESALAASFSVPAEQVVYDGSSLRMSSLAAYAHTYRVNVVRPEHNSYTYTHGLWAGFGCGFALVMPHLNPSSLAGRFWVGSLRLSPSSSRGKFARGTVDMMFGSLEPQDEYTNTAGVTDFMNSAPSQVESVRRSNVVRICSGAASALVAAPEIDFAAYMTNPVQEMEDILSEEHFMETVVESLDVVRQGSFQQIHTIMCTVLGMTQANFGKFIETWSSMFTDHPGLRVELGPTLCPFIESARQKYLKACKQPLDWWLAGSRKMPRPATPQEWYRDLCIAPVPETTVDTLIGLLTPEAATVYGAECALCHQEIHAGENDTIILQCGHIFHWSNARCPGFIHWPSHNDTCPMCREPFRKKEEVMPELVVMPVVAWPDPLVNSAP